MAITCKVIECNKRPGQESITLTFPDRTGQVLTIAVEPENLSQFEKGAQYRLNFELFAAAPKPKDVTPPKLKTQNS